jgi:RHS repeat-associated protein
VLSGTTTTYTYNADEQRLAAKQGGSTVASATWNGAGELTAYDDSAADLSAASYNGDGLRESATTGSGTQAFDWNLTTPVPQLLMDSASAYIYAAGPGPSEQVNLSTGTVSYLVSDLLGSIRGVVSGSGALTATTSYDAFGNPLTSGGLSSYTPFGFAGGYTDPTGLIYLINRYYDPATGQFISVDPAVAQTLQPFEYAAGNPVSNTDPTGMVGVSYYWSHVTLWWNLGETWEIWVGSTALSNLLIFVRRWLEPWLGLYYDILVRIISHYLTYIHYVATIAIEETEDPYLPGIYCTAWNIYWWATFVAFVYRC